MALNQEGVHRGKLLRFVMGPVTGVECITHNRAISVFFLVVYCLTDFASIIPSRGHFEVQGIVALMRCITFAVVVTHLTCKTYARTRDLC